MDDTLGRARWLPLVLVLAVCGWTLSFDYVHDDHSLIANNADLATPGGWRALATAPLGRWMGPGYPYYRPLAMLSYRVDAALFGPGPVGHHAVNVLLAALCALAVGALARALGEDERVALAAACLFALHPVHAEAVGWIAARADLLCALSALCAWIAHRRGRTALALGMFALALASKEAAIALPLAMFAYDRSLKRVAPFAALALLWLPVRGLAVGPLPLALRHQIAHVPLADAAAALVHLVIETGAHLAGAGTGRLDFTVRRLVAGSEVTLSIAALALLAGVALRDRRAWSAAALAFFVPLAGLLLQPGTALLALRYLYLPSALVSIGLARACLRAGAWTAVVLAALFGWRLTAALAPLADARALWTHEVRVSPGWSVAHGNRGLALLAAKEYDDAAGELTLAIARARDEGRPPTDALFGLGRVRLAARDLAGAAALMEEAYGLSPNFPRLAANLGFVYLLQRRPADARRLLERAVALDPHDAVSRENLASLGPP